MKLFERIKDFCKSDEGKMIEHTFEKWCVIITTAKGEEIGIEYSWAKADALICSVPDYIMIKKEYFKVDGKMYPVQSLIEIQWIKKDTIRKEIPYEEFNMKVFYTNEELGIDKNNRK